MNESTPACPARPRRPYALWWAIGALLVAGMAAFQVYDLARRRAIVLQTTERSYATLARALAEHTASAMYAQEAAPQGRAVYPPTSTLAAQVAASRLSAAYGAVDPGPGSVIALYDRGGQLLAHRAQAATFRIPARLVTLSPEQQGSVATAHLPDGHDVILALQAVPGFPLLLAAAVDKAAVLDAWNTQAMHSAFRTTLLCGSVMLLTGLTLRQRRRHDRVEQRLSVQTALLDELVRSAPEAIVLLNAEERVTHINREFTRLFGYTLEEVRGAALKELIVPPERRMRWSELSIGIRDGQHSILETECVVRDGSRLHVSEIRAPIRTADGHVGGFAIYRDISERRLAEVERTKLEAKLREAEKLRAIGTMAGGIAHDFNSVLAAIIGYGNMALDAAPPSGALRPYLVNMMNAAQRARALIDQILAYSRSTRGKRISIDVRTVAEEALELVRASLPAGIELTAQLSRRGASVIADPAHMHQLLMNLCNNAIQALGARGQLAVAVDTVEAHDDVQVSHGLVPSGRYVRLTVSDTGCGMAPEVLARIFEPFYTTKAAGKGTGLGLALVHSIVTDLGGAIDVASAPGEGSRFVVYLPRSDAEALDSTSGERHLPRGTGERVLLIEDEKALALLGEEMLAALNYEPVSFIRPTDALAEFAANPARFDAVLVDHLMPGVEGMEIARRLRAVRADIPVILMSGYTGPLLVQQAWAAGAQQVLTKPIDFVQLAEVMRGALKLAVKA